MPLAVVLNGARTYVQGSQMLAGAAAHAREILGAEALVSCAFRRITDRLVALRIGEESRVSSVGSAEFLSPAGRIVIQFEELEAEAPRAEVSEPVFLAPDGDLRVGFHQAQGLAGLVAGIVQSVKAFHERRFPGSWDIWFTGLRGTALPLAEDVSSGDITIELKRVIGAAPTFQSLTSVVLRAGAREWRFPVTFAFKSEGACHAA